jgi:hypothetical protein
LPTGSELPSIFRLPTCRHYAADFRSRWALIQFPGISWARRGRAWNAPALVVERRDVAEEVGLCLGRRAVTDACTRSFFSLLKKPSVGALSQPFPLRLIKQIITYSFSRACKA